MKYWLLTTEFPPMYGGGISTYCEYTADLLYKNNHDVTVFVQDFSVSNFQVDFNNNIRVVRFLPNRTNAKSFLGYNAWLSYEFASIVKWFLEEEGVPDILESQEYSGISYYVQQFKLLKYPLFNDLNILITCHAPSFLCLEYNQVPIYRFPEYWTGQMEKSCIRSADLLISPSRYFVSQAKARMDWGGIKVNNVANPMPLEESFFLDVPDFIQNRIVCFGKLAPLKGTFELLRYFESLWIAGHNFQLELVGGTQQIFHPEGRTMEDLISNRYQTFIEKGFLKLHGELSPSKAKEFILSAQVVIVPSLFDNFPYTVLEAMSWGKVLLASKQGGQCEIIEDGVDGFLFDHNIEGDFQDKLLRILSLSSSYIKNIGEKARYSISKRYHPDIIYNAKMKVINDYLSNKPQRNCFPFEEAPMENCRSVHNEDLSNELLSVVIPFYNMGEYIEACVQSVLASEVQNIEVIIIDDGSTDSKSLEKLNELKIKYPLTVYSQNNQGLPATRNFGANVAQGKFLAFLDADDVVEKTYYSKAIKVLDTYQNVHFVGCWVQYFGLSSKCWPTFNPEPPYLLMHNMVNSSALVYKRKTFLQAGLNDPKLIYGMEDWDSVISLVSKGFGGVVLPELLFNYRVRKGSMARSFTKVKRLYLHKYIVDKHASSYKKYGVEIAHLSNNNGSGLVFDNPTLELSDSRLSSLKEKVKNIAKNNPVLRKVAYSIYKNIN